MSTLYIKPNVGAIAKLLQMLYGDELNVTGFAAGNYTGQYTATFISDDDQLVALCVCNHEFVAYAGAALSMIPADTAKAMIAANAISETVVANFYELANIFSKLLMTDSSPHLRLGEVLPPSEFASVSATFEAVEMVAFEVYIPRYGKGSVTFLIT